MTTFSRHVLPVLVLMFFAISPARADRIALVIGVSSYVHAPRLPNPAQDATLMAKTLEATGFAVTRLIDPDYLGLKRAMLDFGRRLRERPTEAGLFFFAGHGVQVNGENYLIPVDANIASEDEVQLQAVNVNEFLSVMNSSRSNVNIIILDACRNNPFASSSRSLVRGLAPVEAPRGTYIGYATSPGTVALDGEGNNSPYTTALAMAMLEPGQPIERVFKKARARVLDATGDKQLPWETSSITGEFFFLPGGGQSKQASNGNLVLSKPAPPDKPVQPPADALEKKGDLVARLDMPPARMAQAPKWPNETCLPPAHAAAGGRLCVSSILDPQFGNRYGPGNLLDGNPATAWVEGAKGDGLGEVAIIRFDQPQLIRRIRLMNGYNKNPDIYSKNNRVRTLRVTDASGRDFSVNMQDSAGWQDIQLPEAIETTWITLEISKVFRGRKYRDTAISELRLE